MTTHAARARLDPAVLLERHRTIVIAGEITEPLATNVIAKLLYLQDQRASAPIVLYIDSPGGFVAPSVAIRDVIDELTSPVYAHCLADARGTALVLLAHGARGHRTATPSAHFGFTRTRAEGAREGVGAQIERTGSLLNAMLSTDTGQPAEVIALDVANERQFDADAARTYGLIDDIAP